MAEAARGMTDQKRNRTGRGKGSPSWSLLREGRKAGGCCSAAADLEWGAGQRGRAGMGVGLT